MVLNLFTLFGLNKKGWGRNLVTPKTRSAVEAEWKNIDVMLKGRTSSQLRQAIISADKTLDNVLRDKFDGEKMSERLKNAKDMFDWDFYQKIWEAHKVRNSLVHESGFEPPYHVLISGTETLRKAVNTLGVKV